MASDTGRVLVFGSFTLIATCFLVATALMAAVVLTALLTGWIGGDAARTLAFGVGGALATVGIALLMVPLIGRFSHLGDEVRMLELCDPGAPLLRELMERAGGTYNHSIMAGALAEAAARAIGANAPLARVGAYYHDIGKLARPQFFAENQMGLRNPHDGAPPAQSAFIITAHVREGVELAEREGLPGPIVDIIAQHHGTSLVTYFYRKATAGGAQVDEAAFRYEGVPPRTREAALVMLADAAEAIARGLADPGPAQIEAAVRKVVAMKENDGQLSSSGMSEEDIEATVVSYAKMLAGLRHARVDYPDDAEGDPYAGHSELEP
ncbi:MAG TPA: HDIG domain-containing metalloprotein [Coriobacteriia bacterium]